jgi:Asp-tRNA(Asn)/Glu-tRNA(Gln) amidotransferase A subunit family amidase
LRNPAAFNGIVGYRPSPGLVPSEKRAHGWSGLPVLGPMARNVADVCLLLSAMASDDGRDPLAYTLHDGYVREEPSLYFPVPRYDLASLRLAISPDFGMAPTENHIRDIFADRAGAIAPMFGAAEAAHPDCAGGDEAFEVLRAAGFVAPPGAGVDAALAAWDA